MYNETKLTPFLGKAISDSREMNRELALKLIETLIQKAGSDGKALYDVFVVQLIQRVNETPFPEASENVRLRIIGIYLKLVPYKDCFIRCMPELSSCLAKCLMDPFDEIKMVFLP